MGSYTLMCAKAIMWILKLILAILLFEITYSSSLNVKKTEQKKPSSSFMDWVNIFSEIKETETDVLQDEEKEPSVVIESEQLENDDKRERDPQRIDFRKNPNIFQSGFWNPTHNGILLNTEFQETLNQVNRVGNQDSCTDEQLSRLIGKNPNALEELKTLPGRRCYTSDIFSPGRCVDNSCIQVRQCGSKGHRIVGKCKSSTGKYDKLCCIH